LRHDELDAGQKVGQHGPSGKAGNNAGHASRGEQGHAQLAHPVEGHQRKADGDEGNHYVEHAHQNPNLRDVFPGKQIVSDVNAEAEQIKIRRDMKCGRRGPAEQAVGALSLFNELTAFCAI